MGFLLLAVGTKLEHVITHPLNRSKRTAEIIWSARKEEIIADSDLREIYLYSFQDFTAEQLWCECAGFHPMTRGGVSIYMS
ncbi:hypothetical protein LOK49_LG11G00992 [Camellia lanceoleosa]|uniref:Uncharacterized protein n=1 Tax=Camellia lanceoleosa TaxID=1840588 RepID=A0ACC0G3V8_9ERIC|nr:hypothetical protein LOK49_LG11G00992 [Camellia lanceoleosa]